MGEITIRQPHEYLSRIGLQVWSADEQNKPSAPVRTLSIPKQELKWPEYWKEASSQMPAFHVIHADAHNPCKISKKSEFHNVFYVAQESCLTSLGRSIRDVALAQISQEAIRQMPLSTQNSGDLGTISTDCFGRTNFFDDAGLLYYMPSSSAKPNEYAVNARFIFRVTGGEMGILFIVVLEQHESHDQQSWSKLAQDRLDGIAPFPTRANATDPCAARIP